MLTAIYHILCSIYDGLVSLSSFTTDFFSHIPDYYNYFISFFDALPTFLVVPLAGLLAVGIFNKIYSLL